MNNIFAQNSLNAIVFKLQVILLMMEVSKKLKSSYYSLSYSDRHPSYSPCCCYGKVGERHILTKCSKCNTFQVINDLVLSKNFKVAITPLCNEPQVWNFTML